MPHFIFSMFGFDSKSSATELIKELLICLNEFDVDSEISSIQMPVGSKYRILENTSKNTIV